MSRHKNSLPVLPLRDIVVFPTMICPLLVGRPKSVVALKKAVDEETGLILTTQKNTSTDDPGPNDVYEMGVKAEILQFLTMPGGNVKVLVEGQYRVRIDEFFEEGKCINVITTKVEDEWDNEGPFISEIKALEERLRGEFKKCVARQKLANDDVLREIEKFADPGSLADAIVSHMDAEVPRKQEVLEIVSVKERLEAVLKIVQEENYSAQIEKNVKRRVRSQMTKTQREYYLNEKMKAIQKELGDKKEKSDFEQLSERIAKTELSDEARKAALFELNRLEKLSGAHSETSNIRNYLEWILSIPWGVKKEVQRDLSKAEKILDEDQYGLTKVKERILEYIAVQQRTEKVSGPILCLVGPPGVGKTTLGESAARATGREFIQISLGGVRDEALIKGFRRAYVSSMPGRIIQSMKKVKSVNPLILLDEVDKTGSPALRGDVSSSLLEVLDPTQNCRFVDNYMDIEYDLSNVLFITTANYVDNIPAPLRDRMEVITLAGYTEDEKLQIAKRHLIPRIRKTHAVTAGEFRVTDAAISEILRVYTRESGVRGLQRELEKLARKTVVSLGKGEVDKLNVTKKSLGTFLGLPKYRFGRAEEKDQVGVVTGLAYTPSGGQLLSIEAIATPGKGRIKSTGKLGTVMKESIEAASSYVQSISPLIGVKPTEFGNIDTHVHVPEGAIPKDGPSAGVAMVTAIVSVLTGLKVNKNIAMTGEVTLRGNILPIGGLRAKLLAAAGGGIDMVLLPEKNIKDLEEIPDNVKEKLKIVPVSNVKEVLELALIGNFQPIEWPMKNVVMPENPAITH